MFDIDFFKREGFQIIRNLVPIDVIETLRDFLISEKNKTVAELLQHLNVKDEKSLSQYISNLSDKPSILNAFDRTWQMKMSGHFSLETRLSPLFLSIAKLPNVRALFDQIFPKVAPRLHMPPTARFVLPNNSLAAVPPHQDVSYNEHVRDFFVLWVPFSEITDQKGGVRVFRGTNQEKIIPIPKDENFWLSGINTDGIESFHCKMGAGDALLLNRWIVHASMPNLSDEARISTDFRFFYGDSKKHYFDFEQDRVVSA